MHPSFEQFVAALSDPALRASIGLSIGDADAAALLTNQDWAGDYYEKWIALFPVAAATPAAAIPAAAATAAAMEPAPAPIWASAYPAASSDPFGPPPTLSVPAAEPTWTSSPRASRRRGGVRTPILVVGSVVVVLALVVLGVNVVPSFFSSVQAGSKSITFSTKPTASATAAALPENTHGLTAREYPLIEAVLEAQGSSIPVLVAGGMTDTSLHTVSEQFLPVADQACAGAAKIGGFGNATYRASFITGYTSTGKISAAAASTVYDAIARYCESS